MTRQNKTTSFYLFVEAQPILEIAGHGELSLSQFEPVAQGDLNISVFGITVDHVESHVSAAFFDIIISDSVFESVA